MESTEYGEWIEHKEWQETLKKIRDYILSLIKKKQSKKDEIKEILEETPKEKETPEKKKSRIDKLKEKFTQNSDDWSGESQSGKQNHGGKSEKPHESVLESAPEDQDEYIPHDSEFGESLWEANRFGEIYPPYLWYYTVGKKSYFDPKTNLWSKRKQLRSLEYKINKEKQKYTYAGIVQSWITAIPMPEWAMPDTESLHFDGKHPPVFMMDQNNCIYLQSTSEQRIAFDFSLNEVENTKQPILEDGENIIFKRLSNQTEDLLDELKKRKIGVWSAKEIVRYIIKHKKYSTKVQWTLRDKSNNKNYLQHLDESPILECFSANTLLVGLCRNIGLQARLVVGHMVQNVSKSGKAFVGKNTGHAWTEVRDEEKNMRIRLDATPVEKDEEEKKKDAEKKNKEEENTQDSGDAENNFDEDQQAQQQDGDGKLSEKSKKSESNEGKKGEKESENQEGDADQKDSESESEDPRSDGKKKSQKWDIENNKQKQKSRPQEKSTAQLFDELIEKAKEDNLTKNAEKIKEALDKIEEAGNKEEVKNILDEAGLGTFSKDLVDKVGNDRILDDEKEEMKNIDDEKEIDKKLNESLLNDEFKEKLKQYAKTLKDKIEDQKKRMKSEMERFGFNEHELQLYKIYKQLEKEVDPEVKRQIQEMQKILPPNRHIQKDEKNIYRSGVSIDGSRLADYAVTWDPMIFKRNKEVREGNEIHMFETILIDRSGSMGNFAQEWSIFRESVKAAIIRAKVLEYFKVDFSILIFDDSIDEVMDFDEKFSSRGKCLIPSKLMKACTSRSWGNSQEPISYTYNKMLKMMKEKWGRSFGNISFIGDGDLYEFQEVPSLKAMIQDLKKKWFGVTAYYINREERRMPLITYYFGNESDGWAIYAWDSQELSKKIIESHRKHLKNIIKKFIK